MSSAKALRWAVAAGALLLTTGSAFAGTSRGYENGGKFVRFDPVVARYNQTGAPFRIVGLCQSACTLFLSIRNVCVGPQAVFQFHAGNDGKGNILPSATRHMQNAYNPKLRRFVMENGYMKDFTFHTISGHDMIHKFGYPACTAAHYAEAEERDTPRGNEGSYWHAGREDVYRARGVEGSNSNAR